VITPEDQAVKDFFDSLAPTYVPLHGRPSTLIERHIRLLKKHGGLEPRMTVLDLGCGPGFHLRRLSNDIGHGIGVDLSEQMIRRANEVSCTDSDSLEFRVDNASTLGTIADGSIDLVIAVGAWEHMPEQSVVLRTVRRVLRPGGRFLCLAGNGDYLWHTLLGPALGRNTRHLPTDHFPSTHEVRLMVPEAGLELERISYWRFTPTGDMPRAMALMMRALTAIGVFVGRRSLWGGILWIARRPAAGDAQESREE